MKTTVTTRYLIAFVSLFSVVHELHEQAHTVIGRLFCGTWGPRDFNVWSLADTCTDRSVNAVALVMGPLFSYSLAWLGAYWLSRANNARWQSLGFSLVFGTVMQARLITALAGGGDEVALCRLLTGDAALGRWLGLLITVVLAVPPLWQAFRQLPRPNRVGYFLGFAFIPMLMQWTLVFRGLGSLLQQGIGAGPGMLGMPLLVSCWTIGMGVVLLVSYRWLTGLFTVHTGSPMHQRTQPAKQP